MKIKLTIERLDNGEDIIRNYLIQPDLFIDWQEEIPEMIEALKFNDPTPF